MPETKIDLSKCGYVNPSCKKDSCYRNEHEARCMDHAGHLYYREYKTNGEWLARMGDDARHFKAMDKAARRDVWKMVRSVAWSLEWEQISYIRSGRVDNYSLDEEPKRGS